MRKMISSGVSLTLVCAGCISQAQFDHRRDVDGDGYVSEQFGGEDCNDANPEVYPGAEDVPYDGVDADCDDWSDFDFDRDEMDAYEYGGEDCDDADPLMQNESFWFPDEDKDGYGDMKALVQACEGPLNYIRLGGDCDDTDAMIRPGVVEVCDGVDNNCDSVIDPPGSEGSSYFYPDSDSDGYGDEEPSSWEYVCTPSEGYTEIGGDCDDTDADVSPAVEFEICNDLKNNNCAWEEDNCGIGGYGYAVNHGTITAVSNVRIEAPSSAEYTNAQLGFWAGGIGDVDQDGQDDFLISAPFQDVGSASEAGAVYLFKGRDERTEGGWGLSTSLNSSITRADRTILGSRSSGALGASASALGDVNGDGYPDFALNHCGYGWGRTDLDDPGSVEIVFGASNFWSLASAPTKIEITGMSGAVGKYTQTACAISSGDMDGDGHRDVVISNTGYGDSTADKSMPPGAAFVFYGPFSTNRTLSDATVKVLPETGALEQRCWDEASPLTETITEMGSKTLSYPLWPVMRRSALVSVLCF